MRTVSTDNYNRPLDFCYPWGMDFKFSITIVPPAGSGFTLTGKEVTLKIQNERAETGVYLLSQDTSDGNITISGLTITGIIPATDITGAAGIDEGGIYNFSLTIGAPVDGNRIQARFRCLSETGLVASGTNEYSLSLVDFSATVNLTVGTPGPPGRDGAGVNLSVDFTFSSLSSIIDLGSISAGQKVFVAHLSLSAGFNNGLSLSVGTDSDNALISQYSSDDCLNIIEIRSPISVGTVEVIKLYPSYSVAPTVGAGNITIYSM